jgi:hypothetical protein
MEINPVLAPVVAMRDQPELLTLLMDDEDGRFQM